MSLLTSLLRSHADVAVRAPGSAAYRRRYLIATDKSFGHGAWMRIFSPVIGCTSSNCSACKATRVISGLLFQLDATDVVTYAVVGAALLTVATLACFVPARRALDVQPVEALRAR